MIWPKFPSPEVSSPSPSSLISSPSPMCSSPSHAVKSGLEYYNTCSDVSETISEPFAYPEPFLRAFDRARRGALAKSIIGYHKNMVKEYIRYYNNNFRCSQSYASLIWIWPEPLVALGRTRVRRKCLETRAYNRILCGGLLRFWETPAKVGLWLVVFQVLIIIIIIIINDL
jgi:hypothetical protein